MGDRRSWHSVVTRLCPSPGTRRGGATEGTERVAAVDIGAVITDTEGIADDEPCDALGSRIAVAMTPATAKTAPTASQEVRHLNLRRDPESTGTTPLCPRTGDARTRSKALSRRLVLLGSCG